MALCHKTACAVVLAVLLVLALPVRPAAAAQPQPSAATSSAEPLPPFTSIPDLINPITLLLPWQCGACSPGQASLSPMAVPEFSTTDPSTWPGWLTAELYNFVAYPIICWLLAIAQALLNAAAAAVNVVVVPGINLAVRLGVYGLLWLYQGLYTLVGLLDSSRVLVFAAWRGIVNAVAYAAALVGALSLAGQVAAALVGALGALVQSALQPLAYLVGVLYTLVPGLVEAAFNPTTPAQITALANNIIIQMLNAILDAIADSQLGWAWYAFVGVVYLRFVLWLIDEAANSNS